MGEQDQQDQQDPGTVREVDVVVVGAGPTGENVAGQTAAGGLSTVVVEAELVGGECSYWACMPSKTLLRPGSALRAAQRVPGVGTGDLDPSVVLTSRDEIVSGWDDASQLEWLDSAGIGLVRGRGRLTGEREVTVTAGDGTTQVLRARHAVAVCTGSAAAVPDIPGLRDSRPWTSREATGAQQVPPRLVVVGGGVVACEMATAWSDLGSQVTVLARSELLSRSEDFAGRLVREALTERGVDVRTGVSATEVRRTGAGVVVQVSDGGTVEADEVLVAAGRRPRTDDLGLAVVGLTDGDWLDTDDTLRVLRDGEPVEWLYAAGDLNHRALLTHQGKYQARAAGDVIVARATGAVVDDGPWGAHAATADHSAVPQVVFTDPEVASVGLTTAAAREAGVEVRVVDQDLASVAGTAVHAQGYTGQARLLVDPARQVVVGATFVGQDVAELLQSATIAVVGEVPISRLWHAVPAYPTISEIWLRLLEGLGRDTALTR
ncbi:pyridine nucleotide-disulfide oxidoreductase [Auraticoccus sp. F435]|uniref:Pyridine nucleotide-disulfide oxidoreductase n=1 Tax=Auraticoccus cholistanensis TaxID=2656650 RepID=A0A6A9V0Q9_9ACTN|nr:pyridine nucleotide-disulfide oxidoreductase [Auraticoccus cholistanensis]